MSEGSEPPAAAADPQGAEPDARFSLANERTFLAWIRTCLGIIAGAVAMHSLGVPETDWLRTSLVGLLLVCAGAAAIGASLRWRLTERALRLGTPLPDFAVATWITGGGICLTSAVLAVAFLFS